MNFIYPERPSTFNSKQKAVIFLNLWPSRYSNMALKRVEPFTSATLLPVQRHSDNEKTILRLADRRLRYRGARLLSKDICNTPCAKFRRAWRLTGSSLYALTRTDRKPRSGRTELTANRLLHRLQGRYIPRLFSIVRLRLTPESTTLHLITDVVQGLVLEYIPGVSMAKLKPGVDVSDREAERISSQVMEALRPIESENCVSHNDIHIGNVVLRDGNRSPVSDEEWSSVIGASPDTHYMRNLLVNPEDSPWKRTDAVRDVGHAVLESYGESMPDDFRRVTFERVLGTGWEGEREKVYLWKIRPGVRCRPICD
ncbi:hypothetical protein ARMGADRAFT_175317 [Armillaria gallica]|uniref:Uncharacterized protein n=1 Tax=Armillaria gallica TaxID=47427 RepID=A0A2H3CBG9_ARMGA|nr:hypothetical protein ARMGADRAFT_175317 [Armillaria gallica]